MKLYIHTHQRQRRYIIFTLIYSYTHIQNFLTSHEKLLYTNFSIGDVVAGTTPMTILGDPLFYICKGSGEDLAPSGRTYRTDDLHIISLALSIGNDIFALRFESMVPINSQI